MDDIKKQLFSVVIPVYDRQQLIHEALDSIKSQVYRPIEIIVVDDGSSDNSKQVIETWAGQNEDKQLSLCYIYQDNQGAGAARNRGLQEITGEFVQYLDSDDRIHPDRLQRLVEVFNEIDADFIQTGFEGFDPDNGEVIEQRYAREGENQLELALRGLLWANTLRSCFRRSLIEKMGPWDTEMICFEDREYVERAVALAEKPIAIKAILASARRGGSTRISDRLQSREGRICRIHCEEKLAGWIYDRNDISMDAKQAFASRLYALGMRSNASGWTDLGKRCADLADGLHVDLNSLGKRRRFICRMGKWGAKGYAFAHWLLKS